MKFFFDHIKQVLALIVVIMTYFIFLVVLFRYPTDNNAISQVIIAVVGGFGTATGYYFGYSSGRAINEAKDTKPLATTNSGDVIVDNKGGDK